MEKCGFKLKLSNLNYYSGKYTKYYYIIIYSYNYYYEVNFWLVGFPSKFYIIKYFLKIHIWL